MVVDVVVGFVLLVLTQDMLAGHSRDDRQMCRRSLSDGRISPVQQKFAVVNDPGSFNETQEVYFTPSTLRDTLSGYS